MAEGQASIGRRPLSTVVVPSFLICLIIVAICQQEVQALKLPSLFSWMQPTQTTSPSSVGQQGNNAATTLSHHQMLMANGKQQSAAEEQLLASASVFEANRALSGSNQAQTGQKQSSLRKPFKSILMLPSKHNQMHLFSSLPKSLFGRFLSSGSTPQATTATTTSQQNLPIAGWDPRQHLRPFPSGQYSLTSGQSQFLQNQQSPSVFPTASQAQFHSLAPQPLPIRQARPPEAGRALGELPKKHALGFGDSGDFVFMDPPTQEQPHHHHLESSEAIEHGNPEMMKEGEMFHDPSGAIIMAGEQPANNEQFPSLLSGSGDQPSNLSHTTMLEDGMGLLASGNKSQIMSNIELTASETHTNSSSGPEVRQTQQMRLASNSSNNETTIDLVNLAQSAQSHKDTLVVGQPSPQQQSSPNQQWDSETASSSLISSSAPNNASNSATSTTTTTATATVIGGEAQQLNSTTGDYLQALFASAKDDDDDSSNKTSLGDGQQAILFLDSQSLQRLQEQSATAQRANNEISARLRKANEEQPAFGNGPFSVDQHLSPETSGSESSTAAIVVAPGDGDTAQSISEQLTASDEQLESFILGPYKGLTSDNLEQKHHHHHMTDGSPNQFRSLAAAASSIQAHHMQQPQFQQQSPVGMPTKGSSLLQQAKSLIQFPFVHMYSAQSGTAAGQGNPFRGQLHSSGGGLATRTRDPMIKEQSAPLPFGFVTNSNSDSTQFPILPLGMAASNKQNNYQQHPAMAGYGNKLVGQQQQQQQQQQSVWPSASNGGRPLNLNQLQNNNNKGSHSDTANQRQVHAPFQQQQHANYFLMPPQAAANFPLRSKQAKQLQFHANRPHSPQMSATQQHQAPNRPAQQPPFPSGAKSNVPYFVDSQQPLNREPKQQAVQVHGTQMSDNNFATFGSQRPSGPGAQMQGAKQQAANLLNNMNIHRQQQHTGYQFVVEHANSPRPNVGFYEPFGTKSQSQQQQQQVGLNQAKKFKSGLYQIDPPKLAEELSNGLEQNQQQQQQLVQMPDSEDYSELQQQRMRMTGADEHQRKVNDEEDSSSNDDEEQLSQQATESPEVGDMAVPYSKQVGASIGVASTQHNNRTSEPIKGQVFSEPLGGGQRLNELSSLKLTQDITLYDFEMPQKQQQPEEPSRQAQQKQQQQQRLASSSQVSPVQHNSNNAGQPISFLDTQVYTVPYTIPMQPATRQQPPNFHQFQSFQYHPMRHPQSAPGPLHHQQHHQQVASQHQQTTYQHPASQMGRFSLPYMAPPAPVRPVQPQLQQMQQQQQQTPFLKSMYQQQANGAQITWPASLPSVPALSIQTLDEDGDEDEQIVNFLPTNRQQHYFQYQPLNTQQQQQVVQNLRSQQQFIYQNHLPSQQQLANPGQHQFVLAIQHQTDSEQPTIGPFTSQPMIVPTQNTNLRNEQPPTEGTTSAKESTPEGFTLASATDEPTAPGARASEAPNFSNSPTQANSQQPAQQLQAPQEPDDDLDDDDSPSSDRKRPTGSDQAPSAQQQAQVSVSDTSSLLPSSPSAFCADRAPGLYADESQRCKAYYQCAPTGHQMFKCNNQTQFNQKTQNCDWWYNVNCGGRQGSQADFEQAPLLAAISNEPAGSKQLDQRRQQPDREAAASSQEAQGMLRGDSQETHHHHYQQQQQQQQQATSGEEQDLAALRQQQQIARAKLGHWSTMARQQQQPNQVRQEEEPNSSISSQDLSSNGSTETPFQQLEQQAAPTSATPVYAAPALHQQQQTSTVSELENFSQRSSTTLNPQMVISTEAPTENSSSPSLPEPKPQVGANLSDEQLQQQQQQQSSSLDDQVNLTTPTTTSTSTISDSTSPSSSVAPSSSGPESSEASAAAGSSEQQPESRLGQQQLRLLQQQDPTDGLDLEQEPEVRDQQTPAPTSETKRLVQSEFGLGVQQQHQAAQQHLREGAKSARSAIRFEFTRNGVAVRPNPAASNDQQLLMSGNLLADDNEPIISQQQQQMQYSNHKYSFGDQAMASVGQQPAASSTAGQPIASIYSTSANQGSVNYLPLDEHYLTAKAVQEAAAAAIAEQSATDPASNQQAQTIAPSTTTTTTASSESATKSNRKLDRRFGARLLRPTSGGSSSSSTSSTAKQRMNPSSGFTEAIAPIS